METMNQALLWCPKCVATMAFFYFSCKVGRFLHYCCRFRPFSQSILVPSKQDARSRSCCGRKRLPQGLSHSTPSNQAPCRAAQSELSPYRVNFLQKKEISELTQQNKLPRIIRSTRSTLLLHAHIPRLEQHPQQGRVLLVLILPNPYTYTNNQH